MSGTSLPHQHELRECLPGSPGGRALKAQRGSQHFADIGKAGGSTTVERYGRKHMQELGRRSAEKRRWKRFKGPFTRRNWFPLLTVIERIVPWWPHHKNRQSRKYPVLVITDSYIEGEVQ